MTDIDNNEEREFTVRFEPGAELSIRVKASDSEAAIDAAYELIPAGICGHCSGWDRPFTLDVSFEDIEPYRVENVDGTVAWEEDRDG